MPVAPLVALIVNPAVPPDSEIDPLNVYVPLAPIVIILEDEPRDTVLLVVIVAVALPFPEGTPVVTAPMVKLPAIVMPPPYLSLKSLFEFAAMVPLLIVSVLVAPPPIALTPPTMIVPLLRVKPPTQPLFPESLSIP